MILADTREIERRLNRYRGSGRVWGDHVLNPHTVRAGPDRPLRPAAVLLAVVKRDSGPTVLFTRRTDHLEHHPGQVSFPGGHVDTGDDSPEDTALRETEEETGINRKHVTVIGRIDTYITGTGFSITPVVGLITPPFALDPDPVEVAEVFEVPLGFLLDPRNHTRTVYAKEGQEWKTYDIPYNGYRIWGVTAGMVRNFYEIVAGRDARPAGIADTGNSP